MDQIECDICIIGAGSAGLSLAAGAAQMGANVVLIEGHKMGGDCLNFGCVPSKALIAAARHAHGMTDGAAFGIAPVAPQIDYAAAKDRVRRVIEAIAPVDSQERFEGLGVRVIRKYARFVSETEVEAGDARITARRFVVASGSRPFVPPIPGLEGVPHHTNETIFDLRERPEHLIVIGGGPIGMEMAQAHLRLGCEVTVIEGGTAFGKDDPEMAAVVVDRLKEEGLRLVEGQQAARVSAADGKVSVETADGRKVTGSHLLVAVGRAANVEDLGLDAAGVKHGRGGVTVGDDLRSSNRRVYAIGDAAGRLQFTHVAGYHAGVVIRSILFGLPSTARQDHLPWVTYTDPELAQVGLTEAQARKRHGARLTVVRFPYDEIDRARTDGKTAGLIKVMVVGGKPVGASIAGAQAGELIGLWALVIANGMRMSAVANMVAPYPTLGEISKRAAGAYFSPKLFDNPFVKRVVGLVQAYLP